MSQESDSISSRDRFSLPGTAAVLLALLAPALGGGTSPMAVAVLLAGIGIMAAALPARGLRVGFLVGAGLLQAVTLGWAWPAHLNEIPWRGRLEGAGIPLAWCTSPEPWVSARAWLLLPGGLVWAGWCAGQVWTTRDRRNICEGLAGGIGLIALVALAGRNGHVPGWPKGTGLGPFANRNETAGLFAMGAFLTVACGVERCRLRGGRTKVLPLVGCGLAWLALLGVYVAALALDMSRAGPLLFAGMTLAWVLVVIPGWKRKPEALAAGVAIGLLLATVFLLTGRGVMVRLATSRLMDFRLKIFSDTLVMIRASPWTGTGLGCFNAIFPLYRNASVLQERVLHPESDWLWLTAEAGLPGLLAMAGILGWMAARAWRGLAGDTDRPMRLAGCVACLGMLAHSFVDVPGHRLGTMMPALLLLGLAASPDEEGKHLGALGWLRPLGLALLLAGSGCVVALALKIPTPLTNPEESLKWAPLDWRLYAERAESEGARGELTAALGDFRRARLLEPNYAGLPFDEGLYWLTEAPRFAIEPWQEALGRIAEPQRAELYQNMLAHAFPSHPELHTALEALAGSDPALELVYFGWATPEEFRADIDEILREDPTLARFSKEPLGRLFRIWMEKGDAPRLALLLGQRAEWLKAGYRALAEYDAGKGDLTEALTVMDRYLSRPSIPSIPTITHDEAVSRFQEDSTDIAAGISLYYEAIAASREREALDTLREMSANSGCPAYVHYLEAQLLLKQGKLEEAWKQLDQCPDGDSR